MKHWCPPRDNWKRSARMAMREKRSAYGLTLSRRSVRRMTLSKKSHDKMGAMSKRSTVEEHLRKCCNSGCKTADIRALVYSGTFC